MERKAPVEHDVDDLIRARWSPYVFDPERDVAEDDLRAMFEAARWTMSSFNAQPWRYVLGVRRRHPEVWKRVLDVLVASNRRWARNAPVLALTVVEHRMADDGSINKAAEHDAGAASAFLTVEATARGIYVHQMAGIDADKARTVFGITGSMEPLVAMAIGYPGEAGDAEEKYAIRDQRERVRKPIEEIILEGGF